MAEQPGRTQAGSGLRSLLGLLDSDPGARSLAADGGHAFVSASLRPYVIAALADRDQSARAWQRVVLFRPAGPTSVPGGQAPVPAWQCCYPRRI